MSERELARSELIARVVAGKYSQKRATVKPGLSVRQIKRLCRTYRVHGAQGLAHRGRGRISNRKISDERRKAVLDIISTEYSDFGPQLTKEVLEKRHDFRFSREWLRRLMIEGGLWHPKPKKCFYVHQIDGKEPQSLRTWRNCRSLVL